MCTHCTLCGLQAQRAETPKEACVPRPWAGQPWASWSLVSLLINESGVGPFSPDVPKPRQALLTLQVDTPQPLPPPTMGHCPNIWSGVSSEPQGRAGSQGGDCGTAWEWPRDCENQRAGGAGSSLASWRGGDRAGGPLGPGQGARGRWDGRPPLGGSAKEGVLGCRSPPHSDHRGSEGAPTQAFPAGCPTPGLPSAAVPSLVRCSLQAVLEARKSDDPCPAQNDLPCNRATCLLLREPCPPSCGSTHRPSLISASRPVGCPVQG